MNRFGYLGCLNIYIIKIRLISVFGFQGTIVKLVALVFRWKNFALLSSSSRFTKYLQAISKNLASLDSSQPFPDCDCYTVS